MSLRISELEVAYGAIRALKGVTLEVPKGAIVTLLGANGAGKSTLVRAISGLVRPAAGAIEFNGVRLDRLRPDRIVQMGVVQVPEGRQVFPDLTVKENLLMGAFLRRGGTEIRESLGRVLGAMPPLQGRLGQKARTLSGGEQQMLALGRALMAQPQVLLCDEPSLGLAPLMVREVFRLLRGISASGVAVLLVEQKAESALKIASHAYVLEMGEMVVSGSGRKLLESDEVRRAYLT